MDPITSSIIVAGLAYLLKEAFSNSEEESDNPGHSDIGSSDWKRASSRWGELLIDRTPPGGDHFTFNKRTNELHATFNFGKDHVPIEKGLGGLVEWDTLTNRDPSETKLAKLDYYKNLGISFKPGERFTYDHPWHTEHLRDTKGSNFRLLSLPETKKNAPEYSPVLDLSFLRPEAFERESGEERSSWNSFSREATVVKTNAWDSFNQPVVRKERERVLENLSTYKLPKPLSHDPYQANQEIAEYWDAKVGCGFPRLSLDTEGWNLESRMMKHSLDRTMRSMMTKEEVSRGLFGINSSLRTMSPSDFSLPKSYLTW